MKLAICVPTAGAPKWQFAPNLVQHACAAARKLGWDDIQLFMRPGLLPMTREICLIDAIQWGADRILWVDDDMTIEPNPQFGNLAPLACLMDVMDEHEECAIVGAIYIKQTPRIPTVTTWHPTYMTKHHRAGAVIMRDIPPRPFECATVGAGFSLLRMEAAREMLEKQGTPMWHTPLLEFSDGRPAQYMNEDVDLCLRMHDLGWEVWADPRPITTHLKDAGPLVYDYEKWEGAPTDIRPFTKANSALFRDERTGVVALDVYTPAETRAKPGYEFLEMAMERK